MGGTTAGCNMGGVVGGIVGVGGVGGIGGVGVDIIIL